MVFPAIEVSLRTKIAGKISIKPILNINRILRIHYLKVNRGSIFTNSKSYSTLNFPPAMKLFRLQLLVVCLLASATTLLAQVTTSTITGKVVDDAGDGLIAATVVAVNQSTGTQYGTTTREDGRFTLPNLRIGGPYTVTASYIGYEDDSQEGIYLALGQVARLNFTLTSGVALEEVLVLGTTDPNVNRDRTGVATLVGSTELTRLPTISRSAADYTRLTPASDGNSFAGRNDQFNNFSLDGSIFNNPFGLDAATPGGQTDAQPISLDAIDQIQVNIAPYDVTQAGFTGASVNAVTKSGTNDFRGTVFGFYRNQDMTGSKVAGDDIFVPDLTQLQAGFSLGGPIIKDKLFFFVNAEIERREDLGSNFLASRPGLSGEQVSRVEASDLGSRLQRTPQSLRLRNRSLRRIPVRPRQPERHLQAGLEHQ